MAQGTNKFIIRYIGDISDVLRKLKKLNVETRKIGRSATKNLTPLAQSLKKVQAPLRATTVAAKSTAGGLRGLALRAVQTIPIWFALRGTFTAFTQVLSSGIKFLVDWEFQLAQIRIVGDDTEQQVQQLSSGLLNLQRTLGISNKDLGEGAKLFRQQGRAISEIIPLLDATAKLSLITGRNVTESVEDLTAILKAFNIEASSSITIVDKLTAVTLTNAITAGDLTSALKQSASTAAAFGVGLEELIGLITAVQTQTRDTGNTVGRAFRTIFVRLGTTASETASRISGVPFFLDQMGNVSEAQTPKLRSLTAIIGELALKFGDLESAEKAELVKSVAGIRRANQLTALFNNFSTFLTAQGAALFGLGEADRVIDILTDTVTLKIEEMGGSYSNFVDTVSNTAPIKSALDSIGQFFDDATFLIDPDTAVFTKIQESLTKEAQDAARASQSAFGEIKIFEQIERDAETFKRLGKDVDETRLRAQLFVSVLERGGRAIDGQVDSLDDLLKLLSQRRGATIAEATSAIIDQRITQAKQDFTSANKELLDILTTSFKGVQDADALRAEFISEDFKAVFPIVQKLKKDFSLTADEATKVGEALRDKVTAEELGVINDRLQVSVGLREKILQIKKDNQDAGQRQLEQEKEIANLDIREASVKQQILDIELNALRTNSSKLQIKRETLELLEREDDFLGAEQRKLQERLRLEVQKLEASEQGIVTKEKEKRLLDQLKASGATQLQLEIQKLAILKEQEGTGSAAVQTQDTRVRVLALQREADIRKQLIGISTDLFQIEGASNVQTIQRRLELEKNLGVQKSVAEKLKDQVGLLEALKKESQDLTATERNRNLAQAIRDQRRRSAEEDSFATSAETSRLRFQALTVGLDTDEIDKILGNNLDEQITETEKNIQAILGNVDSTDRLTSAINTLTNNILSLEGRGVSASQVARAQAAISSTRITRRDVQTQPTRLQPSTPRERFVFPGDTDSTININIDGKGFTFTGTSQEIIEQLAKKAGDEVAKDISTPGKPANTALKQTLLGDKTSSF